MTSPPPYSPSQPFSDQPIASSSRTRSNSTTATTPSSSAQRTSNPSIAPSTPMQRTWRLTSNVHADIARRHQRNDEVRNRWLSEDEGLGGVTRSIGRRRRRTSEDSGGNGRDSPGPSSRPHSKGRRKQTSPTSQEHRRTRSEQSGPTASNIADLPRVENIVSPASPPVPAVTGMGGAVRSPDLADRQGGPSRLPIQAREIESGLGIASPAVVDEEDELVRREQRRDLLRRLRGLLGCALCPDSNQTLHHPLTLPCGHTLSSEHLYIPSPPPLAPASQLPHDIFAAEQRQHQQRLNLWAGVMCPIPSCKRYSPHAGTSVAPDPHHLQSVTATLRGEVLASGVTYYPPPPTAPPAYSAEPPLLVTETGSPLLDVTVDKVLNLVLRELDRDEEGGAPQAGVFGGDTDDEEDDRPGVRPTTLSGHLSMLGPGSLNASTRRRSTLRDVRHHPTTAPLEKELLGLLECDVCSMLLYEPVTTPCQHSFCSKCLNRSLDHSQRCPVCRQDLPSFGLFQDHAVNKLLFTLIRTAFPQECVDRKEAIEREERDARLDTPIFVCTLAFPGMPTILHVFEPRYRLMIRRCIESSSPRFGMVLPSRGTGPPHLQGVMEYGTMLEIQSVQMLPDGRSMVETVGTHRFRLCERGSLDGYTVGRIERIDDISPEEEVILEREAVKAERERKEQGRRGPSVAKQPVQGSMAQPAQTIVDTLAVTSSAAILPATPLALPPPLASQQGSVTEIFPGTATGAAGATAPSMFPTVAPSASDDTPQTTEELMVICRAFIDQLRSGSAPWLLQRLNNTYGSMPTNPSEFSYWMALVMPIDEYEKAKLLPIRSPRLRLKLIAHWVESLRSSWWFSSG